MIQRQQLANMQFMAGCWKGQKAIYVLGRPPKIERGR